MQSHESASYFNSITKDEETPVIMDQDTSKKYYQQEQLFNSFFPNFFSFKIKFAKFGPKFILFILFISLHSSKFKKINDSSKSNELKICICSIAKEENRYIREFINHYKKYGVDKIYLYDNNIINGERFDDILSDYIKNEYVKILNYRGITAPQIEILNHCYKKNNMNYDWLLFYDIDEFINLKNYNNIKDFLIEKKFEKCKLIYLDSLRHTDNDLLFYDNRTLFERFPYINWKSRMFTVKSMIRGKLKKVKIKSTHWLDKKISGCNSNGEIVKPNKLKKMNKTIDINNEYYYIDHFCFKSTLEYINKLKKGDAVFGLNKKRIIMHKIKLYFSYNTLSLQKINDSLI